MKNVKVTVKFALKGVLDAYRDVLRTFEQLWEELGHTEEGGKRNR